MSPERICLQCGSGKIKELKKDTYECHDCGIMTTKLKCKYCEEITEHYVLKRYRSYTDSIIGGSHGGHNFFGPKLIYKCTKCGRERKIIEVFLDWLK